VLVIIIILGSKMRIVDTPVPQQCLTTLKKEDQGTPKTPMGSHNQQETKPFPNPQIEKQLSMQKMGRTTQSSTLLISCSMWLEAPLLSALGVKSCFPVYTGAWGSTLPPQLQDLLCTP
jgi:hypothetical protein